MSLSLKHIFSTKDSNWSFMIACLEDAFPEDERRSSLDMIRLLSNSPISYHVILKDALPVGVFNTWDLLLFRYIEHFAIIPSLRGKGLGQQILYNYVHQVNPPVILEVELPNTLLNQRRVEFYKKTGFALCEREYVQPPYDRTKKPVSLKLMEYGNQLLPERFDEVVDLLRRTVYM
ncbi:GNAT family N-acetyltransferase [Microbacter margulisiae]|uniref:GNAT superfamily N-acetyltransferase n=1 Tax=Microbacter margulisiae TaxID=1350067 RepID=A0A7W5H1B4_9PORP|nr:GNAT family N-acetyltransferase [Microbacter margulisiae]MBB3186186.1 GNAT superfamily N-acetyltransferase [Microbacter margulisiae]